MDRLTEFLREAASREFKLGTHDCGLWLADWFVVATGKPDPAAHLRGTSYGAEDLAAKMMPLMRDLGLKETRIAGQGDIGIVRFRKHEIGAIFAGHWMVLGEHGIRALPPGLGFVVAWKVA